MAFNPETIIEEVTKDAPTGTFDPSSASLIKAEEVPVSKDIEVLKRIGTEISHIPASFASTTKKAQQLIGTTVSTALDVAGFDEQAKFIQDTVDTSANFWGTEVAKNKAEHISKFGNEAWRVGETVGELGFEIPIIASTQVKTIPMTLTELALSSSRNQLFTDNGVNIFDKLKAISLDTGTALIGGYIVNKYLPASQADELKDLAKKIPDPAERKAVLDAYKAIDNAGIDSLDYTARENLLKKIVGKEIVDTTTLSAVINKEVKDSHDALKKVRDDAYKDAGKLASTTDKISGNNINGSLSIFLKSPLTEEERLLNNSVFQSKEGRDVLKRFRKDFLQKDKDYNAEEIEQILIQDINDNIYSPSITPRQKKAYSKLLEFVKGEQDKLLKQKGLSGIYDEARKHHVEFVTKFRDGTGKETKRFAEKLYEIVHDPKEYKVATDMFNSNLNPNDVKTFIKTVKGKKSTRLKVAREILLGDKVDTINSKEGIQAIVSNYKRLDKEGLKVLLGKGPAKAVESNIKALEVLQEVLDVAHADKSVLNAVGDFVSAGVLSSVSPIVSTRIAVSGAKKIIGQSAGLKKERSELIKMTSKLSTPLRRKVIQALMMVDYGNDAEKAGYVQVGESPKYIKGRDK